MSRITPMIVNSRSLLSHTGCQRRSPPTGSSNPKSAAADSPITIAEEPLASSLEQSRPLTNSQPTVLPDSGETLSVPKSVSNPGSLPLQPQPPLPDAVPVT